MPAGTVEDDIMIAVVVVTPTTTFGTAVGGITAPAGWTNVENTAQATDPPGTRITVFWKKAAAGEAGPYSFTTSSGTANGMAGGILSYSGVDPIDPIVSESSQVTTGVGATATAPSRATGGLTNTMLVTFHAYASSSTWSVPTGATTGALTQAFQAASNPPPNTAGTSMVAAYRAWPANTNTGTVTSTAAGGGNEGLIGHSLLLRPAQSITIPAPAGLQAEDVMIASIATRGNVTGGQAPSGWTLVDTQTTGGGNNDTTLGVFMKVAGNTEPASYTFFTSGVTQAVGGISAYRGVDNDLPIDVQAGQDNGSTLNHQTPSITTTVPNTRLVATFAASSARAWSSAAGMTERLEVLDPPAGANAGVALAMDDAAQAAIATVGPFTASLASNADVGTTNLLALRARCRVTIAAPAGLTLDDVMVASISVRSSAATVAAAPAGWTLLARINQNTGNSISLLTYYKVATASEPASYQWTFDNCNYLAAGIQAFSGVDTAAPINVSGGQATATSTAHATPSITPTVTGTMLVEAFAFSSSATSWTAASTTMSQAFHAANPGGAVTAGIDVVGYFEGWNPTIATGTRTATASNDADVGATFILALKPLVAQTAIGRFNAYETTTAAGAILGVLKTKVSGTTVSVDIIALNTGRTAINTAFTGTVRVQLMDASNNSAALDTNGCRSSWVAVQTITPDPAFVAGNNGRRTITFTQANSYPDARLRITFPVFGPTTSIGCSTDNFAVRPDTFANVAVTDTDWATATATSARALNNTAATGGNVHKAGRPFKIAATAVNGAVTPVTTTNYSGSPVAVVSALLQPTAASCPACVAGTVTPNTWSAAAGVISTVTATSSEAGSFTMRLEDQTFADVDNKAGDSTTVERYVVGPSLNVGRFVPDHFVLTAGTTPIFRTAAVADGACGTPPSGPKRSFTYVGQPFGYATAPTMTITAERFGGGTTANYSGNLWQITGADVTQTYSNNSVGPALVTTGASVPSITVNNNGTATATFGGTLSYTRSTTAPIAPFNANLSLTLDARDNTETGAGVTGTPPFPITSTGTLLFNGGGGGIGFDGGDFNLATDDGKTFVYGRARLFNAYGSGTVDLPVPLRTEYYTGSLFVTNDKDHCTSFSSGNFQLDYPAGSTITSTNLDTSHIAITGTVLSGAANLRLTKPTPAPVSPGSALICLDLGADPIPTCTATTSANKAYLQGPWSATTYDDDPSSTAGFGIFGSQPRNFIFQRENF